MGIMSWIRQRRLNRAIEDSLSQPETKTLELINYYGSFPINSNMPSGWNMPPSSPRPGGGGHASDYLGMKKFLEDHPDYRTQSATRVRRYYGFR